MAKDAPPGGGNSPPERERDRVLLGLNPLAEAFDKKYRKSLGMPESDDEPMPVVIELNLLHEEGLSGAEARFDQLFKELTTGKRGAPVRVSNTYFLCDLSMNAVLRLLKDDMALVAKKRAIYRVWPDFPVKPLIDRSVPTVKADAAQRAYAASGAEIVWAVVDSGIDRRHPHFQLYKNLDGDVARLHRDFTVKDLAEDDPKRIETALIDETGHGTHVAGIIGGGLPPGDRFDPAGMLVGQQVLVSEQLEQLGLPRLEERFITDPSRFAGVAPQCRLVSLKVLGGKDDRGTSTNVIRALQYVRENLNGNGKLQRVQGVNLSLGYEFNAKWFACGQSPICVEVDRLVHSGVVVVVAAGNTGYGELQSAEGTTSTGLSLTINDPGNSALAITVGATHRDSPHTFGVSYFSSKGPTGDGRLKPDLVAPGERITSCAAGRRRERLAALWKSSRRGEDGMPDAIAGYLDESGTSMAAPHVSGAIASFLSIRREFIGRPEDVKRIFLETATSLGRERYFQGAGLVDLMRAIQSV